MNSANNRTIDGRMMKKFRIILPSIILSAD